MELSDHLFRRESARMVAALTRVFGAHNLALAEDVVQEAFCRAIQVWKFRGVPENPSAWLSATYALAALMCLHAARLPSRVDTSGNLSSLFDQDRSQWDQELVIEGLKLLELSATGSELTAYHVEAAIASVHAMAHRVEDTDWVQIVSLYDALMLIRPSPSSRSIAPSRLRRTRVPSVGSKRFAPLPRAKA